METDNLSVTSSSVLPLAGHGTPSHLWDSVPDEYSVDVTEIIGHLPPDLTGTLYRNGSGRWNVGPSQVMSILDADGMVSAFTLDGKGVRFANRFVRTKHYLKTTKAGKLVQRGFVHQRDGGVLRNALRMPANVANTGIQLETDALLALWEGGRPYRLDLDTLNTIGICSLDGALKGPAGAYSAHYRHDPVTETTVNFGIDPFFPRIDLRWLRNAPNGRERTRRVRELSSEAVPRVKLRLYETGKDGRTSYLRSVPIPGRRIPMIHDMALTSRYAIFSVSPFRLSPKGFAGITSYLESASVSEGEPSYFLLAPRDGSPVRVVETDPFFSWHCTNAYDDGTDVVIELNRFPLTALPTMKCWLSDVRQPMDSLGELEYASLTRYRISPMGKVTRESLTDRGCEFPQFDQRRTTLQHNISYVAIQQTSATVGAGISRIDHRDGTVQMFCPVGTTMVEPTFVPRDRNAAEDDGWILTVGYDEASNRSRLMIFDAARIQDGPLAEAWLPFHIPMSYHGAFTSRVAKLPTRVSSNRTR